ncbi:uncharacterized protein NP_1958A [Natronomonas pharaonis DSM 2160]|uniref:Uncharacterized protein n=1 Tax=Natronomonas pharaonis (strain ATCC 35678 / DSM 2160 / CIP 103997 / JCM 8858 / NBRC 14720 / NCIMB 2260 / Gabara) TaxID=348780 RepID=A0A1U7EVN4_NATPD|nr:uncharacterized protein NP_1958A [Natronomonas pharaonis DSM 2160]
MFDELVGATGWLDCAQSTIGRALDRPKFCAIWSTVVFRSSHELRQKQGFICAPARTHSYAVSLKRQSR